MSVTYREIGAGWACACECLYRFAWATYGTAVGGRPAIYSLSQICHQITIKELLCVCVLPWPKLVALVSYDCPGGRERKCEKWGAQEAARERGWKKAVRDRFGHFFLGELSFKRRRVCLALSFRSAAWNFMRFYLSPQWVFVRVLVVEMCARHFQKRAWKGFNPFCGGKSRIISHLAFFWVAVEKGFIF